MGLFIVGGINFFGDFERYVLNNLSMTSVVVLMATSMFLLVNERWRYNIVALAIQYLAMTWLVSLVWPWTLTIIKLVVGWMACAVLAFNLPEPEKEEDKFGSLSGMIFRIITAALAFLVAFSSASLLVSYIPTGMVLIWGSLILIAMGLLQLGMTNRIYRIIIGLLTVLSGFEILYATIESSILVAGLLTLITMGLALAGPYLRATAMENHL